MITKFTSRELKEHTEACSSIKKIIRHPNGETIIFKERALLKDNGNPLPLETFLSLTGQRKMSTPTTVEPKTDREISILKACKSDYNASMRKLFGPNWRVVSRALNIFNVPEDTNLLEEIKSEIAKFYGN